MPPAVLADSDDDDDSQDLAVSAHEDRRQSDCDAANERSTSSTEQLRMQIETAESALRLSSGPIPKTSELPAHSSSRETLISDFGSKLNDQRSSKRAMAIGTLFTATSPLSEDRDAVQQQPYLSAASGPMKSQEHSSISLSDSLPPTSIQIDFLQHEPTLMFRDTGSTIEDTSSAQHRILQTARGLELDDQTHATRDPHPQGTKSSSSSACLFPEEAEGNHGSSQKRVSPALADQPIPISNGLLDESTPKPQASPVVEIPRGSEWYPTSGGKSVKTSPSSSKNQGRGPCTLTARVSSGVDDQDFLTELGLPREMYRPRPSRRRATQIPHESVDLSVRPERAAKVKRHKSTPAGTDCSEALKDIQANAIAIPPRKRRKVGQTECGENAMSDFEAQAQDSPPKKRGRGRPPSRNISASVPQSSSNKVLQDSGDEDIDELCEPLEQPKKGMRKSAPSIPDEVKVTVQTDPTAANVAVLHHNNDANSDPSAAHDSPSVASPNLPSSHSAAHIPTPSPERSTIKQTVPGLGSTTTPSSKLPSRTLPSSPPREAIHVSPKSHSPIRNSSKVPLRVGLNKRHRIPPLLRTIKPPRQ